MKYLLLTTFICCSLLLTAQDAIDGNFSFQTDPAKKYSLYIPSGYTAGTPHKLMLGLHPLNPARWDAESWRDTLITFAETNNLVLVCPDGGADGRIDDPIDTAFTTALLDSVMQWYSIDEDKVYAMGFSWGGRTTYSYGLSNFTRFGGFIPIGAAVTGTNQVTGIIQNATVKPFYLVHGSQDNPAVRYTPIKAALENNNAIVNALLMNGIGHTIDFPNRNQILTTAYEWVDSVNCSRIGTAVHPIEKENWEIGVFPNPVVAGHSLQLKGIKEGQQNIKLQWFDQKGQLVAEQSVLSASTIVAPSSAGVYLLRIEQEQRVASKRIVVKAP